MSHARRPRRASDVPYPFFISPHAITRYRERVEPYTRRPALDVRALIAFLNEALQTAPRVVEPDFHSEGDLYALRHGDAPFYAVVMPGRTVGQDGTVWPTVASVFGPESVVHGKVVTGRAALVEEPVPGGRFRTEATPTMADGRPRPATLLPEVAPYWERYTDPAFQAQMRPLVIRAGVVGPVAGYDRLQLDNLLAGQVLREALGGDLVDGQQAPYLLPAPLYLLWRDPAYGLPLWASNPFVPEGQSVRMSIYWHKRMVRGELMPDQYQEPGTKKPKRPDVAGIKGRYKEKRIPLPAEQAPVWSATCIGDADEIARLLERVTALGKRRLGLVQWWEVADIERFEIGRPVPEAYCDDLPAGLPRKFAGWTPPYFPGVPPCQGWCVEPNAE